MQSVKASVQNIGASAVSGKEKTKAVVQEKVDKVKAHTPTQKELATEKKEERIREAELNKQHVVGVNAAAKSTGTTGAHAANPTSTIPHREVAGNTASNTEFYKPGSTVQTRHHGSSY